MSRWALTLIAGFAGTSVAAPADDLMVPAAETVQPDASVAVPSVPSFELPPYEPGLENPRSLRVTGKKLLDTKIKVRGYVIWIYNCLDAVRQPKEPAAKAQKRIDDDPTLCERPKFYLGSAKTTAPDRGLWVVDVPRPPNKLEKTRLPKEELKAWPKVPKFKLGDFVVVTGDFKLASPHNERNSDGLLVFESIEAAKTPKPPPMPTQTAPSEQPATAPVAIRQPARKPVDPKQVKTSKAAAAKGNLAFGKRQHTDAVKAYREAIAAWDDNHLAWYGLGGTHATQADWAQASVAFDKAWAIRPDSAMYAMWSGVASYELTMATARGVQAKKLGVPPESISVDLAGLSFAKAQPRLESAVQLDKTLWRAQLYLGRVLRAQDLSRAAAKAFTEAVRYNNREAAPYIALAELYRRWDYTQQALDIARVGVARLPPTAETSDVWHVLGLAQDDAGAYEPAIEAYTKALELRPDNAKTQFQRGQAYFKVGKYAEARTDLEAFVKAAGPSLEFAKQQASRMLMDIEARKPAKKK